MFDIFRLVKEGTADVSQSEDETPSSRLSTRRHFLVSSYCIFNPKTKLQENICKYQIGKK